MREFFWLLAVWMLTVPTACFVYLAAHGELEYKEVLPIVAIISTAYIFGVLAHSRKDL